MNDPAADLTARLLQQIRERYEAMAEVLRRRGRDAEPRKDVERE